MTNDKNLDLSLFVEPPAITCFICGKVPFNGAKICTSQNSDSHYMCSTCAPADLQCPAKSVFYAVCRFCPDSKNCLGHCACSLVDVGNDYIVAINAKDVKCPDCNWSGTVDDYVNNHVSSCKKKSDATESGSKRKLSDVSHSEDSKKGSKKAVTTEKLTTRSSTSSSKTFTTSASDTVDSTAKLRPATPRQAKKKQFTKNQSPPSYTNSSAQTEVLAPYGVYSTDCIYQVTKADLENQPQIVSTPIALGDYRFRFAMQLKAPSSTSSSSSSSTNENCYVCCVIYQKGPLVKSKIVMTTRFRIKAKLTDWQSGAITGALVPNSSIKVNSVVTKENQESYMLDDEPHDKKGSTEEEEEPEPIMCISVSIDFRYSDNTDVTVSDDTDVTVKSSDNTDVTV